MTLLHLTVYCRILTPATRLNSLCIPTTTSHSQRIPHSTAAVCVPHCQSIRSSLTYVNNRIARSQPAASSRNWVESTTRSCLLTCLCLRLVAGKMNKCYSDEVREDISPVFIFSVFKLFIFCCRIVFARVTLLIFRYQRFIFLALRASDCNHVLSRRQAPHFKGFLVGS